MRRWRPRRAPAAGLVDGLLRLSIGIEALDDLQADLAAGLAGLSAGVDGAVDNHRGSTLVRAGGLGSGARQHAVSRVAWRAFRRTLAVLGARGGPRGPLPALGRLRLASRAAHPSGHCRQAWSVEGLVPMPGPSIEIY